MRFVKGNVNDCLDDYEGRFDVIHCRLLLIHVCPSALQDLGSNANIDRQTDDHARLLRNLVKCLRPRGVLLLFDIGKSHRVVEDTEVECWSVKYLDESCATFSRDMSYGEDMKKLVLADEALDLRFDQEYWFNGNWVDPQDPRGPEVLEAMKIWNPVGRHLRKEWDFCSQDIS